MNNPNLVQDINESYVNTKKISIYDNCMNLILLITAKISNLDLSISRKMIENFVEHINNHLNCFNYFISFYRLYSNCGNLKELAKECGLYSHLFSFYNKIYKISFQFESVAYKHQMKDLNSLEKDLSSTSENSSSKKYFLENFKPNKREINLLNKNSESNSDEYQENLIIDNAISKTEEIQGNIPSLYNSTRNTKLESKTISSAQDLNTKEDHIEKRIELKNQRKSIKNIWTRWLKDIMNQKEIKNNKKMNMRIF